MSPANTVSRGGGGVQFEHRVGADLLNRLLVGSGHPALDATYVITEVAFQTHNPVDDLRVRGVGGDGDEATLFVAGRRKPGLRKSDRKFITLVGSMLDQVDTDTERFLRFESRLGLAIRHDTDGTNTLSELCVVARNCIDGDEFADAVQAPRAHSAPVRKRYDLLLETVEAARRDSSSEAHRRDVWRLLRACRVMPYRLEPDDPADLTAAIDRLGLVSLKVDEASTVQTALLRLASEYGVQGSTVDAIRLRRDLQPHARVGRATRSAQAWTQVDQLQTAAEVSAHRLLTPAGDELVLKRAELAAQLTAAIDACGRTAGLLVITGEPSVGKSAATLRSASGLAEAGEAVIRLNLADLPGSGAGIDARLSQLLGVIDEMPVARCRAIVVDGGEAVTDGRARTLQLLAARAASAGLGLVVVLREDLLDEVEPLLGGAPSRAIVGCLTDDEIDQLAQAIPALRPAVRDARSRQIIGRIGLAALLVQALEGSDVVAALSEAMVMRQVWNGVVRRRESPSVGASPDDRAIAVEAAAREALGIPAPVAPGGLALERLRFDRILARPPADAPWEDRLRFVDDAIRDLAVAWVLLKQDFTPLRADAPKWALRAARIAAQASIESAEDASRELDRLQTIFGEVSERAGERWSEIPSEALVTVRSPGATLSSASTWLLEDQRRLQRVLRVVRQRHHLGHDALEPVVATPVLDVIADHFGELPPFSNAAKDCEKALLRWLEGLALRPEDKLCPTRQRFAQLLAGDDRAGEETVEAVALLGPDLGEGAAWLRALAENAPWRLRGAMESLLGPVQLARHHPNLLLELAPAYYIEETDDAALRSRIMDNGIRDMRHGFSLGHPFASPLYGPFWQMLNSAPVQAISVIDRIVSHALGHERELAAEITIDLPGAPGRTFVGDLGGWGWYRGMGQGPHPCMSALMAVERFADHLVSLGIPVQRVLDLVLGEERTTAMLAVAVGFTIRHLEEADDYLLAFLTEPRIWLSEIARVTGELMGFLAGPRDDERVTDSERRRWDLRQLGVQFALSAFSAEDDDRFSQLAAVRDAYLTKVEALDEESRRDAEMAICVFDRANYRFVDIGGHRKAIYEAPDWVAGIVRQVERPIERMNMVYQLMTRYSRNDVDPQLLRSDIGSAKELEVNPPAGHRPEDAITMVAAAALRAHAAATVRLPRMDLSWAVEMTGRAASVTSDDLQYYSRRCDRTAAAVIGTMLMPRFHEASPTRPVIDINVVRDFARHLLDNGPDEVRRIVCLELRPVWDAPCGPGPTGSETCRHHAALGLLERSARSCRLGPYDQDQGRRPLLEVEGALEVGLDDVPGNDVMLNRLPGAIAGAIGCALSDCCAAPRARPIAQALVRTYRRGAGRWHDEGFEFREWDSEPIAAALLDLHDMGDPALVDTAVYLADHPRGLSHLLHDVTRLATYDPEARRVMADAWSLLADRVTAQIAAAERGQDDQGHWSSSGDAALASLVPVPRFNLSETKYDEVLDRARGGWPDLSVLERFIDRWIVLAAGSAECVDALAGLARLEPNPYRGLRWVERLTAGHTTWLANRTSLLHLWLRELTDVDLDPTDTAILDRIIDALAAAGDDDIARLQRD